MAALVVLWHSAALVAGRGRLVDWWAFLCAVLGAAVFAQDVAAGRPPIAASGKLLVALLAAEVLARPTPHDEDENDDDDLTVEGLPT